MTRFCNHLLLVAFFVAFSGCSDDGDPVVPDTLPADSTVDSGVDTLGRDQSPPDLADDLAVVDGDIDSAGQGEGGVDGAADAGADATQSDTIADVLSGNKAVYGQVRLTTVPGLDGRGTLFVGIYASLVPPPFFPALDMVSIANVDLSSPQLTVPYAFAVRPQPGQYLLYAFLDDNENASSSILFIVPDNGDAVVSQPILIEVPASSSDPIAQNIDLDVVLGGPPPIPDAGVGDASYLGALRGRVSASVQPLGDGVGNVWVRLSSQQPPAAAVGFTLSAADLSSPYNNVRYFLGTVEPGTYYVEAFLDDNENADGFNPLADAGDLIHTSLVPIRIESGVTAELDIVLDTVKQ